MKAYLCSIGETTTQLCKEQLERYGFDVVMLDRQDQSWQDKYLEFIDTANEDCIRVDADVIPNKNIELIKEYSQLDFTIVSFMGWDFYKNDLSIITPIFYKKEAILEIRDNKKEIGSSRPETDAWRLPNIVDKTFNSFMIVGIHGIAQEEADIERAKLNKTVRKQIDLYDFELADKIINLWKKTVL